MLTDWQTDRRYREASWKADRQTVRQNGRQAGAEGEEDRQIDR